jgi:hypothetical protein
MLVIENSSHLTIGLIVLDKIHKLHLDKNDFLRNVVL